MFFILRQLLRLRYRVTLEGADSLRRKHPGGFVFLPNHVAYVDPPLLFAWLWPRFHMRPVVVEFILRMPLIGSFLKKIGAISIPDFETSINQFKTRKTEKALAEAAASLKRGENVIFYPSGKFKKSGLESLQGNSGAYKLLAMCPEANIVLVRTSGLWGSSFSKAQQGTSPDLMKTTWRGFKILLKNGLFFTPKRNVKIELEQVDLPKNATRVELNLQLENWYNRGGEEPLYLAREYFWSQKFPEVKKVENHFVPASKISTETRTKLYAEIRQILDRPELKISPEMRFTGDLGMDSLNLAEFIAYLGQNYNLGPLHPDQFDTVQDALALVEGTKQSAPKVQTNLFTWPEEKNRPGCFFYPGRTFPEVFLNVCEKMGPFAVCADDAAGVLTYAKAKQAILVLAQAFRQFPEERVALMLPASVGVYLVYFALLFAGKVPVMLNWTLGPRYLEEMMKISGAKRVLTSWRFLERLSDVDFGTVADQIELLEDFRANLTLGQKIKGALLARCSPKLILRVMGLDKLDENKEAIILFTSGTEAKPKGVPLSHFNILENERVTLSRIAIIPQEICYGILPPFHSFGFSANGVITWFLGAKIAYFPDPTDSYSIAAGIERWKVTLIVMSPTFFKRLLQIAKPDQVKSIRCVVMGAEKVSDELYDAWVKINRNAEIIEGYGATECSPVISIVSGGTMARLGRLPEGVGQLNSGFSLKTIHPETQEPLPDGAEGEICVAGPCVFRGYLGDTTSPFIEIDGKKWYRTGDIGRMDAEGVIHLTDRLKRFAKIGGEMISLRAIEQTLFEELLKQGKIVAEGISIAVCADERLDKQQLILFTTAQLSAEEVNKILEVAGFSRLVKISVVKQMQEIPLMATGKVNYRKLKEEL